MALGALASVEFATPDGSPCVTYPGSAQSGWFTLHDDISSTVTASSATVLRTILTTTLSSVHPAKVPPGATRMYIRARYPAAVRISTTMPKVQIYSIYGEPTITAGTNVASWANDGTVTWMRIDASTIAAAAQTLTVAGTTDSADATYQYTDPIDLTGFDHKLAKYVMGLVQTAGVITTSSGTIQLQAMFGN